ncbi:MAG: FAD-binding protein, partial [Pseudomonadota bacterium]|nr:FAD-binding protein [Pseudomonadota bacterium]
MSSTAVARDLLRDIPGANLIDDPNRLRVYESDGLTAKKQLPALVAIPDSLEALQQIVKVCYRNAIPLVARGAGTGLSGGATPHAEGVLVSLARFNRILEVDAKNLIARVEPGVTNLAISDAASEFDLFYAPDPSSQVACTIGGNVAENSGGVHCLKYGLTVHNVQGLKVLTAQGEIIEVGGLELDQQGFDLLAVLH